MALNLGTLSTKGQATLHLEHPDTGVKLFDENNNPVEIVVYGKSSKQYRNAFTAMQDRHIQRGKKKPSAALYHQEAVELLVACSIRANNMVLADGSPIDTPEAFTKLYNDDSLEWVKDQVDNFLGDTASFLQK